MTHRQARAAAVIIAVLLLFPIIAISQSHDKEDKIAAALGRATDAGEVIKAVLALPEGKGIPKDVREHASLLGVLTEAGQTKVLLTKALAGKGVSVLRQKDGQWSLPAFFSMSQITNYTSIGASRKRFAIVLVTTNLTLDDKGKKVKTKPVADEDKERSYAWAFADGELKELTLNGKLPRRFYRHGHKPHVRQIRKQDNLRRQRR
jgi:hypothetical protein